MCKKVCHSSNSCSYTWRFFYSIIYTLSCSLLLSSSFLPKPKATSVTFYCNVIRNNLLFESRRGLLKCIGKFVRYFTCFENSQYYHSREGKGIISETSIFHGAKNTIIARLSVCFPYVSRTDTRGSTLDNDI